MALSQDRAIQNYLSSLKNQSKPPSIIITRSIKKNNNVSKDHTLSWLPPSANTSIKKKNSKLLCPKTELVPAILIPL